MSTVLMLILIGILLAVFGAWLVTTCPHSKGRLPEDIQ